MGDSAVCASLQIRHWIISQVFLCYFRSEVDDVLRGVSLEGQGKAKRECDKRTVKEQTPCWLQTQTCPYKNKAISF